jgi:hypothetical protein
MSKSIPNERVAEERILWIPLVVLTSAVISFIGPIWQAMISVFPNWIVNSLGASVCNIGLTTAPFLVMLIVTPFTYVKSLRNRINIKMLGYLYIASIVSSLSINYPWALGQRYLFASRYVEQDLADKIVPWFMSPSADVCRVMAVGGPVKWGEWIVPILWFWAMNSLFGLFFISIATILRRHWIDIERVPFPQTLVVYTFAQNTSLGLKWSRQFIIGIAIGLIFQIPITLTGLFPWFPDIYSVKYRTCPFIARWFGGDELLGTIPGIMSMNYNLPVVAIGYLAPLTILFSTWVFALIRIIAVQVAYALGYYSGITSIGTCGRFWCSPSPANEPPLKFEAQGMGALIMIGIMYLVLNRHYVLETIKSAVKGSSVEAAEPYRVAYVLLIASFIALVLFWIASSLSPIEAFLFPIAALVMAFPPAIIYGHAGVHDGSFGSGFLVWRLLYPTIQGPPTTQQWIIAHFFHPYNGGDAPYSWASASVSSFASYKMASLCGIDNKKALGAMIIATLITPLISLTSFVWIVHTLGGANVGIWKGWFEPIGERFHLVANWWNSYPTEPWIEYVLTGAVIGGVLSWAHARFVWFPLEPMGFVLGTTFISSLTGIWTTFFVAWLLKTLTLRIGGTKLYENYGVPIASGVVVGCMIGTIFGGIAWIVRYFIPF